MLILGEGNGKFVIVDCGGHGWKVERAGAATAAAAP